MGLDRPTGLTAHGRASDPWQAWAAQRGAGVGLSSQRTTLLCSPNPTASLICRVSTVECNLISKFWGSVSSLPLPDSHFAYGPIFEQPRPKGPPTSPSILRVEADCFFRILRLTCTAVVTPYPVFDSRLNNSNINNLWKSSRVLVDVIRPHGRTPSWNLSTSSWDRGSGRSKPRPDQVGNLVCPFAFWSAGSSETRNPWGIWLQHLASWRGCRALVLWEGAKRRIGVYPVEGAAYRNANTAASVC